MKKMYFIVNLVAGKARISKKLGAIVDEFTKAGYYITIHTTQSGDDAAEWAKYACHHGYDLLVSACADEQAETVHSANAFRESWSAKIVSR